MDESTKPQHDAGYYEVRPSPAKGLGAFAIKEIASGSLILAEAPTIILVQEVLEIRDADIEAALLTLTEEQCAAFHALSAPPTQYSSLLLRTFLGNSMSPAALPGSTCLCLQIARFNHSCRPNAEMAWNPFTTSFDLYAVRKIKADEEILWNYIPGSNYMPKSYRQFLQYLNWRFICNCETCEGMTEEWRVRQDMYRKDMYLLRNALQGFELSTLGRDSIVARGISIEHTWKPSELEAILTNLWQPPRELPDHLQNMDAKRQINAWNTLTQIMEPSYMLGKELALTSFYLVDIAVKQPECIDSDFDVRLVDECMAHAMRNIRASRPRMGPDVQAFEAKREEWEVAKQEIQSRLNSRATQRTSTDQGPTLRVTKPSKVA